MDHYIDVWEVSEYGNHFKTTASALGGVCPFIDVPALVAYVFALQTRVEAERAKAGLTRGMRAKSGAVTDEAGEGRGTLRRFYSHLLSIDARRTPFDLAAFFERGKLGKVSDLKPADVRARLERALNGFDAPENAALATSDWKPEIAARHAALGGSVTEHGAADTGKKLQTSALGAAREDFLDAWYGVAKPAIAAVLAFADRSDELRNYFKDHQVTEGGPRGATDSDSANPAPPGDNGAEAPAAAPATAPAATPGDTDRTE